MMDTGIIIEERIIEIIKKIVHKDEIDLDKGFLMLGFDSMKLMYLSSEIEEEFEVDIPLSRLVAIKSMEELVEVISDHSTDKSAAANNQKSADFDSNSADIYKEFQLTDIQQAYFYGKNSTNGVSGFSTHAYFEFEMSIDIEKFNRALNKVICRHPMLRTVILDSGKQKTLETVTNYEIPLIDCITCAQSEIEGEILEIRQDMSHKSMDITKWPLFEFRALRISEKAIRIFLGIELIILDGLSMQLFISEIMEYYYEENLSKEPLGVTFYDYVNQWEKVKDTKAYKEDELYWKSQIEEGKVYSCPVLEKKESPKDGVHKFKRLEKRFTRQEYEDIKQAAECNNTTASALLCTVFAIVLSKWSNQEKLTINMTTFDRMNIHRDMNKVLGDFTVTMPLSLEIISSRIWELASPVQKKIIELIEHSKYSGIKIAKEYAKSKGILQDEIFPVVFTSMLFDDNMPETEHDEFDILNYVYAVSQTPQVYLDFQAVSSRNGMLLSWDYAEELFEAEYINSIFDDCVNMVQAIAEGKEYDLYRKEKKFIQTYNNTEEQILPELLHKMIEKQVLKQPDVIAIKLDNDFITYRQLWKQSNKIARYLKNTGIEHKDFVMVKASRTIQTIVNIIGILKAGAAYVPIGEEWPKEREEFIKESVSGKIILNDSVKEKDEYMLCDDNDLEETGDIYDPAYIIYTSGSTGKPKGVVITHGAVSNTIKDINNKFNVNEQDKIIGISSLCFDLSVYDIFGALSSGARLILIHDIVDIQSIYKTVQDEKITIWNTVPSIMEMLVDCERMEEEEMFWASNNRYCRNISLNEYLRLVLLSGDWIKVDQPQKIWDSFPLSEVVSLGGATEASIWSIYYPIKAVNKGQRSIPYGYPLANQTFYILNNDGSNTPIRGIGELYIGGAGVALEYKNDEEKTQTSFILHPIYGRIYKTGDFGRFSKEGYIEFLGRKDNQVKINGHRIELGEIENCLLQSPGIKKAVVIDYEGNNGKALYAYYVADRAVEEKQIKEVLTRKLPSYMIPVQYIKIDEIPLSDNGKVDRKKLRQYESKAVVSNVKTHNLTRLERELIGLCKELLEIDNLDLDDNILLMGGDSLKVIQLLAKVKSQYKVDIPLRKLFNNPTIREMANSISQLNPNIQLSLSNQSGLAIQSALADGDEIKHVEKERYNVSASQNRMFILNQINKDSITYNTTAAIRLIGELDKAYLKEVLQQIIKRHEILRTSYVLKDNVVYQKVNEQYDFILAYVNCMEEGEKAVSNIIKEFVKPFDLSEPLIIRAKLIKIKSNEYILVIDSHHIAFDAISKEIMIKEFCSLYNKEELPRLPYQYKAYAQYEYDSLLKGDFGEQEKYWAGRLAEVPDVDLHYDFDSREGNQKRGAYYQIELDKAELERLHKVSGENGATLYMILLAVINIWISKLTLSNDIIIGSPFAGRNKSQTENMIGMFVNTVPIRNSIPEESCFHDFLKSVCDNVISDFENGMYPFNLMVEKNCKVRAINSNPLFNVFFALQNMKKSSFNMGDILAEDCEYKNSISKFDVSIYAYEIDAKLKLEFEYDSELFREETVCLMAESILYIANQVADNPDVLLKDISVISKYERNRLEKFNDTRFLYAREKTVKQLFEEQAAVKRSKTALHFKGKTLTYRQLNDAADKIAGKLYRMGVKANDIVPVMTGRSFEMFIALLGVIKSGAAYLPLDPKFPKERITYMIQDSQAKIMLVDKNDYLESGLNIPVINVSEWECMDIQEALPEFYNKSTDLLYVIYTSGSTGLPKGVEIPNMAVHNFMNGVFHTINFRKCKKILAVTTISFDIFGLETVVALCKGLEVVIADEKEQKDSELLGKLIKRYQVEIMQMTPSMLKMQLREGRNELYESVKVLMVGGEVFPNELLKKAKEYLPWSIYNMYGPTETTIWSTISDLTKKDRADIGEPIANTQVFIVDETGRSCPIGVPGELCISGDGLARGYHNREELTKEKFIESSFDSNLIIYRTGDYARWTSTGYLECIGRIDNQVKIRGHRIELEEIEQQINKIKEIDSVALNVETGANGESELQAYVIMKEGFALNVKEIRNNIRKILPDYMMPAAFYEIAEMPLTNNQKVDRKKLKPLKRKSESGKQPLQVSGNTKEILLEIWKRVLGKDDFDENDNFFEVGGNSLSAVEIVDEVNKILNTKFHVTEFFEYPSLAGQAEYICKGTRDENNTGLEYDKIIGSQNHYDIDNNIAIIGVACKFPESDSPEEFWENIVNKKELIHFYSKEEMLLKGASEELVNHPSFVPAVSKLEETDFFDADFFGYTRKDASFLDPQVRLFEECAWDALTDGGYSEVEENNNIGVFGGSSFNYDWISKVMKNIPNDFAQQFAAMQLNDRQFLTTQTSYKLNLKGPSYYVGSACSTSLVAIHNACRALVNHECDMALAGGVSITEFGEKGYIYQQGMILSKDGHCRPFDKNGNGTVFSDGAGVILMKPLRNAIRDKDNIYAVIKGTGINNDGNQKAGFTAPSVKGESGAIERAFINSGIKAEQIGYVETHGTGTSLGDPIEIEGLRKAFSLEEGNKCAIGSVKANIGHTDAAAGIAGVIKTVFALKNKTIPPSINFEQVNENIDLENTPFYINTEAKEWESADGGPLRAGVSSFGIGGTNAHIILEEAPYFSMDEKSDSNYKILALSAKTETSLEMYMGKLEKFISSHKDFNLNNLTYTMACRRKKFDFRECIVFQDFNQLMTKLKNPSSENFIKAEKIKIIFLFPGQGSQYVNMGKQLYASIEPIREIIDRCFHIAARYTDKDYKSILFGKTEDSIHETETAQFLLFTLEYALAEYLIQIGFVPDGAVGHSIGEYVEAVLAGVFSLEDAIKLVCSRGRYMQQMEKGKMLSVMAAAEAVEKECDAALLGSIDVAAVNTPDMCVFSGSGTHIYKLAEILKNKNIKCSVLNTSHAYHSRYMREAADNFKAVLDTVTFHKPHKTYLSNVYGCELNEQEIPDSAYWIRHMMSTVEFGAEISCIMQNNKKTVFLEVGPGKTLSTLIKCNPNYSAEHITVSLLPTYDRTEEEQVHFTNAVADLWKIGAHVNWQEFYLLKGREGRIVSLPAYAYEKEKLGLKAAEKDITVQAPGKSKDIVILTREYISRQILNNIIGILGCEGVKESDNLFSLGADSVKMVILSSQLKSDFGIDISMKEVLSAETIGEIIDYIYNLIHSSIQTTAITKSGPKEKYEVSSIQKRMFLLSKMDDGGINYNIAEAVRIVGSIDVKLIKKVLEILTIRHPNLKSYFKMDDGGIYQYVDNAAEGKLYVFDLQNSLNKEARLAAVKKNFIQAFSLEKAPLFKMGVVLLNANEKVILLNAHHIIMDGTSMNIVLEDLMNLVRGNQLKELNYNYFDYIHWMKGNAHSDNLVRQNNYWKKVFKDKVPVLNLPLDFERGEMQTFEGKSSFYAVDRDTYQIIEGICKAERLTLYTFLLAIFNILMSKISGDEDIVIGCPVDSRGKKEFYNVVGMFVNTLPIRNYPDRALKFREFLRNVKDNVINAFENQELQMEVVINDLKANTDKKHNPLFDVMLVEQNMEYEAAFQGDIKVSCENYEKQASMLDITIYYHKSECGINFEIEYCTKLFKQETIDNIFHGFETILQQIIENRDIYLEDIILLNNYKRLEYSEDYDIEFSF